MVSRTSALTANEPRCWRSAAISMNRKWRTPSAAPGWRVQDVVAHLGSGCHSLFTPVSLKLLRSRDIERTNDAALSFPPTTNVFPITPRANINALAIMAGERCAQFFRAEHSPSA
jgi:hypothetical protein